VHALSGPNHFKKCCLRFRNLPAVPAHYLFAIAAVLRSRRSAGDRLNDCTELGLSN